MTYIWASKSLVLTGHKPSAVDADTDRHDFGGSGSDLLGIKIIIFATLHLALMKPILSSNDKAISETASIINYPFHWRDNIKGSKKFYEIVSLRCVYGNERSLGIVKHPFTATPLGDGINLLLHQSSHPGTIQISVKNSLTKRWNNSIFTSVSWKFYYQLPVHFFGCIFEFILLVLNFFVKLWKKFACNGSK